MVSDYIGYLQKGQVPPKVSLQCKPASSWILYFLFYSIHLAISFAACIARELYCLSEY